jgi:hypothetical protein
VVKPEDARLSDSLAEIGLTVNNPVATGTPAATLFERASAGGVRATKKRK